MKLPSFQEYEPLDRLLAEMGVSEIVSPEDDYGAVWEPLGKRGIDIEDINDVEPAEDGTLTYEGYRILVYIRDQYLTPDGRPRNYRYHVAECETLQKMRQQKRFGRYVGTNRKDGTFIVNYLQRGEDHPVKTDQEVELRVCKNCLKTLDWAGYLHMRRSEQRPVWESFNPESFFEKYTTKVACLPIHNERTAPINVYSSDWKEVSRGVRERANWRCEECGVNLSASDHRKFLHVHHIDGNKPNNQDFNLVAVCIHCHALKPDHGQLRSHPDYRELSRILESSNAEREPPFRFDCPSCDRRLKVSRPTKKGPLHLRCPGCQAEYVAETSAGGELNFELL